MDSTLDLLWLRVPLIRYVSPPACNFESSGSGSSGPIIVVEHPPRFKVTGLRVENCTLFWDALPGVCEGACSVAICYNVYRSDTEAGYEVIAECVNATEFSVSDNACYRVSAITSEGESDLSDAVCVECGTPVPPVPPVPDIPVLQLNIDSLPAIIKLQWGQDVNPEVDQIWRSDNGADFVQIDEVPGGSFYNDISGISTTDIWCYKVRGRNGELLGDFSNVACAVRDIIFLGMNDVSYPTWQIAFGDVNSDDPTLLTSLDFSGLRAVIGGTLFLDATIGLTSVDLSSLISVSGSIHFSLTTLNTLSLPALTTLGGDLLCDNSTLTDISIPVLILLDGNNYRFDSSALNAASVEGILARGIASGVTSATINLDAGTNAGLSSLSAQGQADYAALVLAGNTVTINP